MDRTALLSRWSELAPEECEITASYTDDNILSAGQYEWTILDVPYFRAVLLAALIEAIRKRGWHYRLESDETEPENDHPTAWHAAEVWRDGTAEPLTVAAEPCDALLQAYCLCLQAGKERDE